MIGFHLILCWREWRPTEAVTMSGSYWLGTEWGQTQLWHRSPGGRDRGFSVTLRGRLQPQLYKRLETLPWVGLTPGLSSDGKAIICGGHSFHKHVPHPGGVPGHFSPLFLPLSPLLQLFRMWGSRVHSHRGTEGRPGRGLCVPAGASTSQSMSSTALGMNTSRVPHSCVCPRD